MGAGNLRLRSRLRQSPRGRPVMSATEPSYYYTGAPRVAGIPIPSEGCVIDGSHTSDSYLSERILSEAQAYGMPVRLCDSVYWHERIAQRYDEREARAHYWQGVLALIPERSRVGLRVTDPVALADRAMSHRWAHSDASESAVDWLNEHSEGATWAIEDSCLFVEFTPWAAMSELAAEYWVCVDCYFAHHYGAHAIDREPTDDELADWHGGYLRTGHTLPNMVTDDSGALMVRDWFAGESDTPSDREPLGMVPEGWDVTDWVDSETGEGERSFDGGACDGCGSSLGGARYRLAVWHPDTPAYNEYWRACVADACDALTVESWRVHGKPRDALGTGAQR